jgi:hypothetical protein
MTAGAGAVAAAAAEVAVAAAAGVAAEVAVGVAVAAAAGVAAVARGAAAGATATMAESTRRYLRFAFTALRSDATRRRWPARTTQAAPRRSSRSSSASMPASRIPIAATARGRHRPRCRISTTVTTAFASCRASTVPRRTRPALHSENRAIRSTQAMRAARQTGERASRVKCREPASVVASRSARAATPHPFSIIAAPERALPGGASRRRAATAAPAMPPAMPSGRRAIRRCHAATVSRNARTSVPASTEGRRPSCAATRTPSRGSATSSDRGDAGPRRTGGF